MSVALFPEPSPEQAARRRHARQSYEAVQRLAQGQHPANLADVAGRPAMLGENARKLRRRHARQHLAVMAACLASAVLGGWLALLAGSWAFARAEAAFAAWWPL